MLLDNIERLFVQMISLAFAELPDALRKLIQ